MAALASANTSQSGPNTAEWYFDTGASSHMTSNAGNFISSRPVLHSPPITIDNGMTMPVTHRASTVIPTSAHPLKLNNILVSPSLVKNLISVCSLTKDNNVSVEFDPFGFSIKDLPTQTVLLRCNSAGDHPMASSSPSALVCYGVTLGRSLAPVAWAPWTPSPSSDPNSVIRL